MLISRATTKNSNQADFRATSLMICIKGWLCHCQYPYEGNGKKCKMASCPPGQAGQGGQCIPLPAHAICSPSVEKCLHFKCEAGYSSVKVYNLM